MARPTTKTWDKKYLWEKVTVIRWFCFLSYRKALRAGGAGPALHPAPAYSSK